MKVIHHDLYFPDVIIIGFTVYNRQRQSNKSRKYKNGKKNNHLCFFHFGSYYMLTNSLPHSPNKFILWLSYLLKKPNRLWNVTGAESMAFSNEIRKKSENLLQQLRGCKFITDINRDALKKDPFLKEFLAFKMDVAQGYIAELQIYERLGDQNKCKSAMENAVFFLGQIQVLLDRMLDEQCEEAWLDFQKELRFTNHVPVRNEYVLKQNTNELALAA